MVHEVPAEGVTRSTDALRKAWRSRVQKDASGLERSRGQHYDLTPHFARGAGGGIDINHTIGAALGIGAHVADDGIAYQRETACPRGGRQSHGRTVKVRGREAAASTLIAI